jgi:hypothetical protein
MEYISISSEDEFEAAMAAQPAPVQPPTLLKNLQFEDFKSLDDLQEGLVIEQVPDYKQLGDRVQAICKAGSETHPPFTVAKDSGFRLARVVLRCSRGGLSKKNLANTKEDGVVQGYEDADLEKGPVPLQSKPRASSSVRCGCEWKVHFRAEADGHTFRVHELHLQHTKNCRPNDSQHRKVSKRRGDSMRIIPYQVHALHMLNSQAANNLLCHCI